MKKYFIFLLAAGVLAACNGNKNDAAKLQELEKKHEGILAQIEALKKEEANVLTEITDLKKLLDTAEVEKTFASVRVEGIQTEPFTHSIEIQGTVYSDNNVTLAAENGGKVLKVYVTEGQSVSAGQKLADLDGGVLESQLAELNTRLELAEQTYAKQDALWKKQIGTEMQYLQAKNNLAALKNQRRTLQEQVSKFHLVAPFSGVIDDVNLRIGEVAAPGTPAIRIVNLNSVEVKADVSEKYVGAFNKGDKVKVYFPALNDTINAEISAVGMVINPNNRTFSLRIALDNKSKLYKPNLLAIIQAVDFKSNTAISIPSKLVQTVGNRKFIYLAEQNDTNMVAIARTIETGPTAEGRILVKSGLQAGESIITDGYLNLEDGDLLKILK